MNMPDRCTHLRDLNAAQIVVIRRHIDEHKWFQHIADEEDAKLDFIEKFRWIMREVYCGFICCERFDCDIAHDYLPTAPNQSNPVPKDILDLAMDEIIRRHLDEHKWFQHIADPEEAKKDFSAKFGWIMKELICGFACEQRYECPEAKAFLLENKKIEPQT
jgi:hypothetical protein